MNTSMTEISIDSKNRSPLFIAIKGAKDDGHCYIDEAIENGAKVVILDNRDFVPRLKEKYSNIVCVLVRDSLKAFHQIAHNHKTKFESLFLLGITGSNGKTTTKEMIASLVSKHKNVLKSERNYNNQFGVPLTLLNIKDHHELCITEIGTSGPGEIESLSGLVLPDYAIVTNIAPAHLQGLNTVDNVFEEKSALVKAIPEQGMVFLNKDDDFFDKLDACSAARVVTFGINNSADYMASDIDLYIDHLEFKLNNKIEVDLNCTGIHNVYNALAAIAFAHNYLGNNLEECVLSLNGFAGVESRFSIENRNNIVFINDTYNANPGSYDSAFETLKQIKNNYSRLILFVGDMLELGEQAEKLHYRLGKKISELSPDLCFVVGEYSKVVAEGIASCNVFCYPDVFCVSNIDLVAGDLVFVKGSRGVGMERLFGCLSV